MATQNPLEMEGTYPLPEAQFDRFFYKLLVRYPRSEDIEEILDRTKEATSPQVESKLSRERIVKNELRLRPTNEDLLRQVASVSGGVYNPDAASIFSGDGTAYEARPLWP